MQGPVGIFLQEFRMQYLRNKPGTPAAHKIQEIDLVCILEIGRPELSLIDELTVKLDRDHLGVFHIFPLQQLRYGYGLRVYQAVLAVYLNLHLVPQIAMLQNTAVWRNISRLYRAIPQLRSCLGPNLRRLTGQPT